MSKSFRALACLAALWVIASTFGAVWRLNMALPTYDHWAAVDFCDQAAREGMPWEYLWRQHNEHRLAVPRLLFLVDFFAFGGRGLFLLATTALVQLAHALVLWRLVVAAARPAKGSPLTAASLVAIALFSSAQMFNFLEPFQVSFVLAHAAAAVALLAAVRASDSHDGLWWWFLAVLAAVVAALSLANGMLVCPLLVAAAWLRGTRRGRLAMITAVAAAVVLVCLLGFKTGTAAGLDPWLNIQRPWRILAYAACWVGSPIRLWNGDGQVLVGGIAGGAAIVAFLALAGPVLRHRRASAPATFVLAMIGVFLLVTPLVVAVARSGISLEQAQSDRYATPSLLFWVVLCALGAARLEARVRTASIVVAILLVVAILWQQKPHVARYAAQQSDLRRAEFGVMSGVRDAPSLAAVQPAEFMRAMYDHWIPALQQHRWSVFASPPFGWVGRRVSDCFELAEASAGSAAVDRAECIAETGFGYRVQGWAWDHIAQRAPRYVLLVGSDEVVVGLAETCATLDDATATPPSVTHRQIGWAGYAAATSSRLPLRAWIVLTDGRACPGATVPLVMRTQLATTPRDLVADTHFLPQTPCRSLAGAGTASALGIVAGPATLDAEPGRIDVGPLPARPGVIGLPIMVGPCNGGQSVHLIDLVTFEPIAGIHPPPTHGDWAIWRVEITPSMVRDHLGFIAIDQGARPGQWIAVGKPVYVD